MVGNLSNNPGLLFIPSGSEALGAQVSLVPRLGQTLGCPSTAAPCFLQLVREDTDPASEGGNADSEKEKVSLRCGQCALGASLCCGQSALQPCPAFPGSP